MDKSFRTRAPRSEHVSAEKNARKQTETQRKDKYDRTTTDNCYPEIDDSNRLMRLREFVGKGKILPISKMSWYRGISVGRYPPPIKLSPNVSCWKYGDILEISRNGNFLKKVAKSRKKI